MAFRLLAAVFAALVLAPASFAADAPRNVRAFQLRADESEQPTHTFGRTPAFAWDPVPGADHYELELSTSRTFAENAVVWEDRNISGPLTTVPLTLPWISGARYSWFARVRGVVDGEAGPWSALYGFNMRPSGAPKSLSNGTNPIPGMVRWTPIDGATAYEVVFLFELGQGKVKKIKTATTAADLREYYTLHNGREWANVIYWRVRAVREPDAQTAKNGLPAATYGPWSSRNRTVEPALGTTSSIGLSASISRSRPSADVRTPNTTSAEAGPHELIPGFAWSGALSPAPEKLGACPAAAFLFPTITCPLYHVYVYTDADCVNRVHVSDVIGSPAYVPRLTPPLKLPADSKSLGDALGMWLGDGEEGNVFDAGGDPLLATGVVLQEASSTDQLENAADEGEGDSASGSSDSAAASGEATVVPGADRKNSLWDNDSATSRYYWTVVPVVPLLVTTGDGQSNVEWHDVAFGQDMCSGGDVGVFGKTSAVASTTSGGSPFASGMSSSGKLVAASTASPTFYGKPVVAWKPAPGAQTYEVQWSKKSYPWKAAGKLVTPATSALLDLPVGHWYYRVRGLDRTLPGLPGLTWSDVAELTISPPTFSVVARSGALTRTKGGK
jgi:hypothetical protein